MEGRKPLSGSNTHSRIGSLELPQPSTVLPMVVAPGWMGCSALSSGQSAPEEPPLWHLFVEKLIVKKDGVSRLDEGPLCHIRAVVSAANA